MLKVLDNTISKKMAEFSLVVTEAENKRRKLGTTISNYSPNC
jgi:hypothetical protein